ncbi:MAG TPA: efflux RND transporter periplasmic adaptor subunit [Chitinophagales bacterium]|nr:efflux RND transporter periplasmic adaptor subunit [Chitinophagales bacterium]
MDRVIPQKKWSKKRLMTAGGVVGLVLLIAASIFFTAGKSKLNVDTERITISEVKNGAFQEFIPVNGVVLPLTTIYLDAIEGGRVEEKFVEDGAILKAGDPILKLVNTDLELDLANRQTAVFDVLTQMQNTKNLSDQNTIRELNQMADVINAYQEAKRIYELDSVLYSQAAIGSQEYQSAKNNYEYQTRRKKLSEQTLASDSISTKQQLTQMKESYEHMQNALSLMQRKVGDLIVRAPVDGQLTSLDAEIGESKNKGDRLGQLDVLSGFKVRVDIDEHYISRIFTGLMGDFTFANKTYQLKIKKVFTQVTNGRFQVDMEFVGEVPQGIRRGQTLQIRLALSDETTALLLPKGGFFQQTGGNWIFKVNSSGNTAYKTDIQIGRQNPDYYEVLSGLKPGDKVVTSSYENYGAMDELVLKK